MELVKNRQQFLNIVKIFLFPTIVKDKFSFKVWPYPMQVLFFVGFFFLKTSFSVCKIS